MSKKPVSLARVLLWSSLGIENVLVIALVILRTDIEYFSPFGFEYPPEQKAELLSALTSLRWATLIPWLILANGLGIAIRAYLLWRSDRSKMYSVLIWGSAVVAVAGFYLSDYMMMSRRFDAYPRIFQAQVITKDNQCAAADILVQWGKEGCQYITDRLEKGSRTSHRVAAAMALGEVPCDNREKFLWMRLRDPQENFYLRLHSAAALDWLNHTGQKNFIQTYLEEIDGLDETIANPALARNIERWLEYNQDTRKTPKELYTLLFPSICWRITDDPVIKAAKEGKQ